MKNGHYRNLVSRLFIAERGNSFTLLSCTWKCHFGRHCNVEGHQWCLNWPATDSWMLQG